jgi:SAM-dependent methyltransferase
MTDRASINITKSYTDFYHERSPHNVYPVEFVVRAFLGSYPRLKTEISGSRGKRVLDLGFGDGRNMPLLHNLGMEVFGVEISQDICDLTQARMNRIGVDVNLRVGRNSRIPYEDAFFDNVLACHACHYVDSGTQFSDNVREIARVTKSGGRFIFSAPMGSSYILRGASDLGEGHMEIANDPYGVRKGAILKKFDSEAEIGQTLSPFFIDLQIGSCRNDWWGIEEHVWTVVCRRT